MGPGPDNSQAPFLSNERVYCKTKKLLSTHRSHTERAQFGTKKSRSMAYQKPMLKRHDPFKLAGGKYSV